MEAPNQIFNRPAYNINNREHPNLYIIPNIHLTMPNVYGGGSGEGGGGNYQKCTCPTYKDLLIDKILNCILYNDKECKFPWYEDLKNNHKIAVEKLLYIPVLKRDPKIQFLCGNNFDSDSLCATLPKDVIQVIFTSIYPLANFNFFENFVTSNRTKWEREKEIYHDFKSFPSKSDIQFLSGYKFDTSSLNQVLPAEILNIILTFKHCLFLNTDRNSGELDKKFYFNTNYGVTTPKCKCFSKNYDPFGLDHIKKIQNDIFFPKFDLNLPKIDIESLIRIQEGHSFTVLENLNSLMLSDAKIDFSIFKEMHSVLIPLDLPEEKKETGPTKPSNSCVIC